MSRLKLYMDEDSMDRELLFSLLSHGVDVRTARDEGMQRTSDEEQLRRATQLGRALYSFNVRDFYRLHGALLTRGEEHAGLILVPQRRYTVGEQTRGLLRLVGTRSAEQMRSNVEFLSAWIPARG